MTQLFNSSNSTLASEKRSFGQSVSTNKPVQGASQKIKTFFRIGSSSSIPKEKDSKSSESSTTPKSDLKTTIRQSRFLPQFGRNRSQTVASEGNTLDEHHISPTVHANPYFQHQGPPLLRHHNEGSVPPSPPDTPKPIHNIDASTGAHDQQALANREELARKLRRVASAPNAQGLFQTSKTGDRPQTGDSTPDKSGLTKHSNASALSVLETTPSTSSNLAVPSVAGVPSPGQIRQSIAFRRTYSSNSIKVRSVEVGPGSFDKIKLIGKGDVGKVYLVREKKSTRLYAMKGA